MDEISEFSSARAWSLIQKKCKEMLISFLEYSTSIIHPIYVAGLPVESIPSFKLLGFTLSRDLPWSPHVDFIMKKPNSRLYALRQLKRAGVGQQDLVSIYCLIIRSSRSRVEYAAQAWSILTAGLSNSKTKTSTEDCLPYPFLWKCFSLLWPRDFRSTENQA